MHYLRALVTYTVVALVVVSVHVDSASAGKEIRPLTEDEIVIRSAFELKLPYERALVIVDASAEDENNLYQYAKGYSQQTTLNTVNYCLEEFFGPSKFAVMDISTLEEMSSLTWESCIAEFSESDCSELKSEGMLVSPEVAAMISSATSPKELFQKIHEVDGSKYLRVDYRHQFYGLLKKWDLDLKVIDGLSGEVLYHARTRTSKSIYKGILPILNDLYSWLNGK